MNNLQVAILLPLHDQALGVVAKDPRDFDEREREVELGREVDEPHHQVERRAREHSGHHRGLAFEMIKQFVN